MTLRERLNELNKTWVTMGTEKGSKWIYIGEADKAVCEIQKVWNGLDQEVERKTQKKLYETARKKEEKYKEQKSKYEAMEKEYAQKFNALKESGVDLEKDAYVQILKSDLNKRKGRVKYYEVAYNKAEESYKNKEICWLDRQVIDEYEHKGFWDKRGRSLIIYGSENGTMWTDDEMRTRGKPWWKTA